MSLICTCLFSMSSQHPGRWVPTTLPRIVQGGSHSYAWLVPCAFLFKESICRLVSTSRHGLDLARTLKIPFLSQKGGTVDLRCVACSLRMCLHCPCLSAYFFVHTSMGVVIPMSNPTGRYEHPLGPHGGFAYRLGARSSGTRQVAQPTPCMLPSHVGLFVPGIFF